MGFLGFLRRDRRGVGEAIAVLTCAIGLLSTTAAQTATTTKSNTPAPLDLSDTTVEQLFKDFLHYARIGMFTQSHAQAKALLVHPDLNPVEVMKLADQDRESIDTLQVIIKNAKDRAFVDAATQVLDLVRKGEFVQRQDVERIAANIEKLGGTPQQELMAIGNLVSSGEYAIPHLIKTLLNPDQKTLRSRILNAMPKIGKPAVNPLVMALAAESNDLRQDVIDALGKIGYPQAVPYLKKMLDDPKAFPETKSAASRAIERIASAVGRETPGSAEELFVALADRYFSEDDTVRADPRLDEANVWYWDTAAQGLKATVVPRKIFGSVMAMRCCEEAILLRGDNADAVGLWLASNIRREDRLGMNVENDDPEETGDADKTRPSVFPRALYFTQAAGPRYAHRVLERALKDSDASLALAAIAALRVTAGESSLIGSEDFKQPLARCLQFPDLVVRIKAALALGAALPKTHFSDSQFVVPTLSHALAQSGRQQVVVVDAEQGNANRVSAVLRAGDRDVITETAFFRAIEKARTEFQAVSGVFLSTDIGEPGLADAMQRLRAEFTFARTPVVLLVKPTHGAQAAALAKNDALVETVDASATDAAIEAAFERVRGRSGQSPLQPEAALSLALQAADVLRRIAADGRTVFSANDAAPALIGALSAADERLQTSAAGVLALCSAPAAQRAIAHVALGEKNPKSLRRAAFASLAESAKNHGNQLEPPQISSLLKIVQADADLAIRTAATQTLGALNLSDSRPGEIIRAYHGE